MYKIIMHNLLYYTVNFFYKIKFYQSDVSEISNIFII